MTDSPSSSSSSESSASDSSSSESESGKSRSFEYSTQLSSKLSKWTVSGIDEKEVKSAREAFKPKLRKFSEILKNPSLDESLYFRLKKIKKSSASKANIDLSEKTNRNLTYKILDLAKPLLFLNGRSNQKKKSLAEKRAARYALKLWAALFNDVIRSRRKNILSQIYPEYISLLDDKKNLPGGEHLFGPKFVHSLISQVKTLTALDDPGPSSSSGRAASSNNRSTSSDGRNNSTQQPSNSNSNYGGNLQNRNNYSSNGFRSNYNGGFRGGYKK